jgi:hypothetical protein
MVVTLRNGRTLLAGNSWMFSTVLASGRNTWEEHLGGKEGDQMVGVYDLVYGPRLLHNRSVEKSLYDAVAHGSEAN